MEADIDAAGIFRGTIPTSQAPYTIDELLAFDWGIARFLATRVSY